MGMSDFYGPADEAESIATIHAALDAGITLLDTGDFYGMGHNELLIRDALRGARPRRRSCSASSSAPMRGPDGAWLGNDARPPAVKNFLAYTLRRLGTDHVDIYRPGRASTRPCRSRRRSARSRSWCRPATSATSASPRSAPRRSAAPTRCTRSPTCRSSTRCSRAGSRTRSCRPAASSASASPPTASSPAACSAATGRRTAQLAPARLPRHRPRFRARTSSATSRSSRRCARRRERRARPSRSSRSPGCSSRGDDIVPLVGARRRDRLTEALGALELDARRRTTWRRSSRPCPRRRRRRALRAAADGDARQRALAPAAARLGALLEVRLRLHGAVGGGLEAVGASSTTPGSSAAVVFFGFGGPAWPGFFAAGFFAPDASSPRGFLAALARFGRGLARLRRLRVGPRPSRACAWRAPRAPAAAARAPTRRARATTGDRALDQLERHADQASPRRPVDDGLRQVLDAHLILLVMD